MNAEKRRAKRKEKAKNARRVCSVGGGGGPAESWEEYYDRLEEQVAGQSCVVCGGAFSGSPFSIFESGISSASGEEELGVVAVCSSGCREEWLSRVQSGYYLRASGANKNDVR